MKITDNGNFTEVELETESGRANFMATMKAPIQGDYRAFVKDAETLELGHFLQSNNRTSQVVVKVGDAYTKIK